MLERSVTIIGSPSLSDTFNLRNGLASNLSRYLSTAACSAELNLGSTFSFAFCLRVSFFHTCLLACIPR